MTAWKALLLEGTRGVGAEAGQPGAQSPVDVKTLHAKIGELDLANDFFLDRQSWLAELVLDRAQEGLRVAAEAAT